MRAIDDNKLPAAEGSAILPPMRWLTMVLPWIQIVTAILLIVFILLQQSEAGLGSAFGGGAGSGVSYTKRGLEKFLLFASIGLAVVFVLAAIGQLFVAA